MKMTLFRPGFVPFGSVCARVATFDYTGADCGPSLVVTCTPRTSASEGTRAANATLDGVSEPISLIVSTFVRRDDRRLLVEQQAPGDPECFCGAAPARALSVRKRI